MEDVQYSITNSQKRFIGYVIIMTCFILLGYSIFGGLMFILSGNDFESINPWLIAVSQVLFLLVPTILAIKPLKLDFSSIFRFKLPTVKLFVIAVFGVLFVEVFTEGYLSVQEYLMPSAWIDGYRNSLLEYTRSILSIIGEGGIDVFLRAVFVVAIVPPICEEFLFRGFLQTNLEKKIKPIYAISISSVLFGAIHLEPVVLVPLILIGIYLGVVAYQTGSILMPIVIHFLVNVFSVMSAFYLKPESIEDYNKVQPIEIALVLLFVGLAGVILVCYYIIKEMRIVKMNLQPEDSNIL